MSIRVSAWVTLVLAAAVAVPFVSATDVQHEAGCGDMLRSTRELAEPAALGPTPAGNVPTLDFCFGIRPGAQMTAPVGCTYNFVFTDGPNLYIGTAGHCATTGQRVATSGIGEFGTVVYRVVGSASSDFALIRIDADKVGDVSPTVCTWGGPLAAHVGGSLAGEVLYEYGWGIATFLSPATRARANSLFQQGAQTISWNGVGSGGDSGAPLINEDGLAMGIHTAGITPVAGVLLETGPYIQRILSLARGAGFNIDLVPGGPVNAPDLP